MLGWQAHSCALPHLKIGFGGFYVQRQSAILIVVEQILNSGV